MAAVFSSLLFTSCLPDDDYSVPTLTHEQRTKWVEKCAGEYFGSLSIKGPDKVVNVMPIDFTVTAKDSMLTCSNFPIGLVSHYVKPHWAIIASIPPQTMQFTLQPFYGAYNQDYSFYLIPNEDRMDMVYMDGETRYEVTLFYAIKLENADVSNEPIFPIALKNVLSDILTARILVKSIYVNAKEYPINQVISLEGYPKDRYRIEN